MRERNFSKIINIVIKIISMVFAIALWLFISYTINPEVIKKYNSVKINYVFNDSDKYILVDDYPESLGIKIKGKRNDLLEYDKESIYAYADLSKVKSGKNQVKIIVDLNDSRLNIFKQEIKNINLSVDDYVEKIIPIRLELSGELPENINFDCSPNPTFVKVKGPRRDLSMVKAAVSNIDLPTIDVIKNKEYDKKEFILSEIPVNLLYIGENFDDSLIEIENSEISVDCSINYTKNVKVKYELVNSLPDMLSVFSKKLSHETVSIEGAYSDVKNINEIICEPVNLSNIKEVGKYRFVLKPKLSKEIRLYNPLSVYLELDVDKYLKKRIPVNQENIVFNNLGTGLKFELLELNPLYYDVKYFERDAAFLPTSEDIYMTFNLEGLDEGEYDLDYTINVSDKIKNKNRFIFVKAFEKTKVKLYRY